MLCFSGLRTSPAPLARSPEKRVESVFDILSSHTAASADLAFIQNDYRFKQQFDEILTYFREPIQLISVERKVLTENEALGMYLHNVYSQSNKLKVARKAAVVILNTANALDSSKKQDLATLGNIIAMTIVGTAKNMVFYEYEINPQIISYFRNEQIAELQQSGKPEIVIEKIVAGQLKKFYEANAICHQFLISPQQCTWLPPNPEGDMTVNDSIEKTAAYLGTNINVSYYKTFNLA